MADDLRTMVEQLKSVSHPLRLRVLALLGSGELCVCQVAEVLQVPASSASEALRELRRAGFVAERKEGRWVFVSLVPEQDAPPLLRGILAGALGLGEVRQDLAHAVDVKAVPLSTVCSRIQAVASAGLAPGLMPPPGQPCRTAPPGAFRESRDHV